MEIVHGCLFFCFLEKETKKKKVVDNHKKKKKKVFGCFLEMTFYGYFFKTFSDVFKKRKPSTFTEEPSCCYSPPFLLPLLSPFLPSPQIMPRRTVLKAGWKGTASTKTTLDEEIRTKVQVNIIYSFFYYSFFFFFFFFFSSSFTFFSYLLLPHSFLIPFSLPPQKKVPEAQDPSSEDQSALNLVNMVLDRITEQGPDANFQVRKRGGKRGRGGREGNEERELSIW